MDDDSRCASTAATITDDDSRPMTFNEMLIQEVRAHPELYDQQHRVCTDNGERNLIWEAIALRIDDSVTGEFAKKRWLQMRDRYRKELKSALKTGVIPKWPYFEKLSWLDPYLKDNKPGSISSSFIGHGLGGFVKDDVEQGDVLDFSNYAASLSANALLENIMAVSGGSFPSGDGKPSGMSHSELSPDSAVASTSDDGDHRGMSSNGDVADTAAGLLMKLEAINSAAAAAAAQQEPRILDQKLIVPLRNTSNSPPTRGTRSRNPPYLVRRGGGLKVKPQIGARKSLLQNDGESFGCFKASPRSASESSSESLKTGNLPGNVAPPAVRVENKSTDDFTNPEWANDEDMLFARLVVVRLKKFAAKERRGIRARISELIDEKEEEAELSSKMPGPSPHIVP